MIRGRLSELLCAVLCNTVVHSHKYTHMRGVLGPARLGSHRCTRVCWFRLRLVWGFFAHFCMFFSYLEPVCFLFMVSFCIFCAYFLSFVVSLVVSSSVVDHLRLNSKVICYVLRRTVLTC